MVSVIFIGAYTWWFQTSWPLSLAYALFSVLCLTTIPICYRLFGFQDNDIIEALVRREQQEHNQMLARLDTMQQDLDGLDIEEGAAQIQTLTELLNDFHEVIANRFRGKQLSSSTYLNTARDVQNQTLQNLSDMIGIGHSIASLKRHQAADSEHQLDSQQKRLDSLIRENRKLFAALSETSVEVANIQEIGAFERTETLARLNDLAVIARQQSR
ncbi:hypothetical protein AB833_02845 [Chromatiales bacterium (ex Bugula neritina AB1)]|nr:hypothetical protein AB833_02845 [Chromatiales bacterium (ex Bugula neritina AB1)]